MSIGSKIAGFGKTIADGTKKMGREMSLGAETDTLKRNIKNVQQELGERYYTLYKDTPAEEFKQYCEELDRLNAELEAKTKELEELAGTKNCPSCGAPIDKGSMFCSSCGAKITAEEPAAEEPAAPAGPVCPNCGQPVPEGHMFCTSCGTKIEK